MENHILGKVINFKRKQNTNEVAVMIMCDIARQFKGTYTMDLWGRKVKVQYTEGLVNNSRGLFTFTTFGGKGKKEFNAYEEEYMDFDIITERLYRQYETDSSEEYYGMENNPTSIMTISRDISLKDKIRNTKLLKRLTEVQPHNITLGEVKATISLAYLIQNIIDDITIRVTRMTLIEDKDIRDSVSDKIENYRIVMELINNTKF